MVNIHPMLAKKKTKRELRVDHNEPGSTKERILRIAKELFAHKGFEGARTRDIAEQAGINISTLHFHWKSKEELYAAVYQHLLVQRTQQAEEIFTLLEKTSTPTDQWEETVQVVVDKMFTFFRPASPPPLKPPGHSPAFISGQSRNQTFSGQSPQAQSLPLPAERESDDGRLGQRSA